MDIGHETDMNTDDLKDQVSRLRAQVDALLKQEAAAMSGMASRAGAALTDATGITREQVRAAVGDVTLGQVGAIVVAAAIGWTVGRLMR